MRYAMIMAGGAGTRLWPMSRQDRPKQLVPLIKSDDGADTRSLLQLSAKRLEGLIPPGHRYICTNEAYREPIKAQMPEFTDELILGEPVGRDTVNAVGFAAAVIHKRDPDAVFAVLTADHIITPEDQFRRIIDVGFRLVEKDPNRLVTFSIKPSYASTAFGYVERGAAIPGSDNLGFKAERFVEKPTAERAQAYLDSGVFSWNSGMFVWKASTILDCLRRYKPESYEGLTKIADAWGTPDQQRVLETVYPQLPKISVDYAIMEPASREQTRTTGKPSAADAIKVATVLMDLQWLDVGSWPSFAETLTPDGASKNRTSGSALVHDAKSNLVVNDDPNHLVTILGVENLIVIHTKDATLVMPADKAQDLKSLHAKLPDRLK